MTVGTWTLAAMLACTTGEDDTAPPSPQATVKLTFEEHDGSWLTPEGWSVELEAGYALSLGLELLACPVATASHGAAVDDRLRAPHVEALHDPISQTAGTLSMVAPSYCEGSWSIGPADTSEVVEGNPTAPDLVSEGIGFYVKGTATPETGDAVDFEGASPRILGNQLTLETEVGDIDVTIEVVRTLDTLFDGVDFEMATGAQIADIALENFVGTARYELP